MFLTAKICFFYFKWNSCWCLVCNVYRSTLQIKRSVKYAKWDTNREAQSKELHIKRSTTVDTSCHSVSSLPILLFNIYIVTSYKSSTLLDLKYVAENYSALGSTDHPNMINIVKKILYHLLRVISFQHL